jgi:hypothetical protein
LSATLALELLQGCPSLGSDRNFPKKCFKLLIWSAANASTAVDFTENYLLAFEEELKKAKDPDGLINAMKERFPSADFILALERGAKANVKPSQTN